MTTSVKPDDGVEEPAAGSHGRARPGVPPTAIQFRPGAPRVRRIRRNAVVATVGLVAGITVMAVFDGLRKPAISVAAEKDKSTPAPVPGDLVNKMPASYDAIVVPPPRLGPPLHGEFGGPGNGRPASSPASDGSVQPASQYGAAVPRVQSVEEKERDRAETERAKRAASARTASLPFATAGGMGVLGSAGPGNAAGSLVGELPGEMVLRQRLAELQRLQASAAGGLSGSGSPDSLNADGSAARAGVNSQDDKSGFQGKKHTADPYLQQAMVEAPNVPVIGAGAIIPGVFLTGINSDLPGQITGQVSQNVYDSLTGNHLLIPQGSMLDGEYDAKVTYGQERVMLVWTRLRMPNGSSLSLEGMPGIDLSGYSGVKDQVNNHWMKLIGGVVFGSVIGATAQVAQGGTSIMNPSFGQLAVQGAGQNINQAGQEITRRNLGIQPTLEIRPGMRFNVFVTKDVVLPDYRP